MGRPVRDLMGQTFGNWTVLERIPRKPGDFGVMWLCRCVCGNERAVPSANLCSGHSKGCRDCRQKLARARLVPQPLKEMAGLVFSRWTVLRFSHRDPDRAAYWWCRCECGSEVAVNGSTLRRGTSTQCTSCSDVGKKKRKVSS